MLSMPSILSTLHPQSIPRSLQPRPWLRPCFAAGLWTTVVVIAGSAAADQPATGKSSGSSITSTPTASPTPSTDGVFIADPGSVKNLGLTTVWQVGVESGRGTSAKVVYTTDPDGDSIFVLDSAPGLARVLVRDGRTVWRDRVGEASDRVLSVARSPQPKRDEVVICLDSGILAADFATGRLAARHKITRLPTTPAVLDGDFAVFGAKAGQVVWQQLSIGAFMHVNGVRGTVVDEPLSLDEGVAVGSSEGDVAVFSTDRGKSLWRRDVGAGVVGNLASDPVSVYARCNDHSVHAMDIGTGKPRWRWKSTEALTGRLFAGGGLVLTRIEGGELVALESLRDTSTDMTLRDGRVAWRSSAVGDPLCTIDDEIMLWDARTRTATTVSSVSGKVSASARFPDAVDIAVTRVDDPDVYLLSSTGLLQRCAPLKRATQPAATAPSAKPAPTDADPESEPTDP